MQQVGSSTLYMFIKCHMYIVYMYGPQVEGKHCIIKLLK